MGRGNWFPDTPQGNKNDYEMVYVDNEGIFGDVDVDDVDSEYYRIFKSHIFISLPDSFAEVDKYVDDHYILAENKLLQCLLRDNEWSQAVAFVIKENAPIELAKKQLASTSRLVFTKLHDFYTIYVKIRCGPWTSGPYIKSVV